MRGLLTLVVVMGVLIVAGVLTLAVTIVHRLSGPPMALAAAPVLLEEPPGTRMSSVLAAGDRLAVLLTGGGPDRLLLLDSHSGRVVGRVGLAH